MALAHGLGAELDIFSAAALGTGRCSAYIHLGWPLIFQY